MLGILLDAGVIVLLVAMVNQGEQLEFMPAALCGFVISLGCWAIAHFLSEAIGIFALVPMVLVAIGVIWIVAKITIQRAAIAGAIFMAYKVALGLALHAMLN